MADYEKKPRRKADLTKESIEIALSQTYGNLKQACRIFRYKDGKTVPWSTFYAYAKKFDLISVAEAYKAELAFDALETLRKASCKDWKAAIEILNRVGKLIDITPPPAKVEQKIEVNSIAALINELETEKEYFAQMNQDHQRLTDWAENNLPHGPRNGEN